MDEMPKRIWARPRRHDWQLSSIWIIQREEQTTEYVRADTILGWLPIESAPKDGTRLLLWIEPIQIAMPFAWDADWGGWMGDDFPLNMAWPTYWMPMPDPPGSRDANE